MTTRPEQLLAVVENAQRAAGLIAARDRGDREGAATLMTTFDDDRAMASGCLLLAELLAQLHARASGEPVQATLQALTTDLETSLRVRSQLPKSPPG